MTTPLKLARLADPRKLSTYGAAEAVGINQSTYHRIENAESSASPKTAEKLVALFPTITEEQILYPERYVTQNEAA